MQGLDSFIAYWARDATSSMRAPIDLYAIAEKRGIQIEYREMIPEAAVAVEGSGFRIFLQANFLQKRSTARVRFSLAHEIAHTFFYEVRDGKAKPLRDAPTGEKLESACHKLAASLLIPESLLKARLAEIDTVEDGQIIKKLATEFEVSFESIIRRLQEFHAFNDNYSANLIRRLADGSFCFELTTLSPWFRSAIPPVKRGDDARSWLTQIGRIAGSTDLATALDEHDANRTYSLRQGILTLQFSALSSSQVLLELRLVPSVHIS